MIRLVGSEDDDRVLRVRRCFIANGHLAVVPLATNEGRVPRAVISRRPLPTYVRHCIVASGVCEYRLLLVI